MIGLVAKINAAAAVRRADDPTIRQVVLYHYDASRPRPVVESIHRGRHHRPRRNAGSIIFQSPTRSATVDAWSTHRTMPTPWHAVALGEVARELKVDSRVGLSSSEAARRLERHGANRLADAPREARWRSFLRQFQDLLILILLAAAVVSLVVTCHWETPAVIVLIVLLNATIGFVQESRAEA